MEDFLIELFTDENSYIPDLFIEKLLLRHVNNLSLTLLDKIATYLLKHDLNDLLPLVFHGEELTAFHENLLMILIRNKNFFIIEHLQGALIQKIYNAQPYKCLQRAYLILLNQIIQDCSYLNDDQKVPTILLSLFELIEAEPEEELFRYTSFLIQCSQINKTMAVQSFNSRNRSHPNSLGFYLIDALYKRDYFFFELLLQAGIKPTLSIFEYLSFYKDPQNFPITDLTAEQAIQFFYLCLPYLSSFSSQAACDFFNIIFHNEMIVHHMLIRLLLNKDEYRLDLESLSIQQKNALALMVILSNSIMLKQENLNLFTVNVLEDLYALAGISVSFSTHTQLSCLSEKELSIELERAISCNLYPIAFLLWQCGAKLDSSNPLHQFIFMNGRKGSIVDSLCSDEIDLVMKYVDSLNPIAKVSESRFLLFFNQQHEDSDIRNLEKTSLRL
jgi:hypothetical protein